MSKQTTKLHKTLSMSWVRAHQYSHCRTLARHTSWVWRHPCFAKERNLSPARHTSQVWRHPCFLKGWNRIFSLCACTLSSHFTMVICWHRTLFLLFFGGAVLMEILSHLLFATNLRLFGFLCGLI